MEQAVQRVTRARTRFQSRNASQMLIKEVSDSIKRARKEKLEEDDLLCPVCQHENAKLPCGHTNGLACLNEHSICITCARKLVRPCPVRCSCATKMHYLCPICRQQCSITPYHAMVLIKGSHAAARESLSAILYDESDSELGEGSDSE